MGERNVIIENNCAESCGHKSAQVTFVHIACISPPPFRTRCMSRGDSSSKWGLCVVIEHGSGVVGLWWPVK